MPEADPVELALETSDLSDLTGANVDKTGGVLIIGSGVSLLEFSFVFFVWGFLNFFSSMGGATSYSWSGSHNSRLW